MRFVGLIGLGLSLAMGSAGPALAWGASGHSIVAEIAQHRLSPKATEAVRSLLGGNISLASIASWADDYKFTSEGEATKPWHYVDVDNDADAYAPGDCPAAGCLVSALEAQAKILADHSETAERRRLALQLLVHLAGDSTQPFHCSERNHDGGGNGVIVYFGGAGPDGKRRPLIETKLHAIWDDTLIDDHAWSWGSYAAALERDVVPGLPAATAGDGFAATWVNECHLVAKTLYSTTPAPATGSTPVALGPDYQKAVQPILDRQLATGGLRLAAILEKALGSE